MSIEASLIYIEKDDSLLMLHRIKKDKDIHEGKWNGLGGKLEKGESPKECACREVKEESNLTLKKIQFLGHLSFPSFDGENDWSVFIFYSNSFKGKCFTENPEGKLSWIKKKEVLKLKLWEGDYKFLPYIFAQKKFFGKIVYQNKKLISCHIEEI